MKTSKLLKIYFGPLIISNGDDSQEIRQKLGKVALEVLGKTTKGKNGSLETKVKIIHPLIFSVYLFFIVYGCESWTTQKSYWKKH